MGERPGLLRSDLLLHEPLRLEARPSEWTEQFDRWGQDKGAIGYPGLCRLHRAQVLTVRGELAQAVDEMNAVRETLIRTSPWMEGEVWRVTGDIHTAKGDFEEAQRCYESAGAAGFDSQFECVLLRLLDGDAESAVDPMRHLIEAQAWSCQTKLGQALAHYAIAAAQAADPDSARAALEKLADAPELVSTPALQALVITARAELELAEGRVPSAISLLRSALATCVEMDAPLAVAHARCRLARVLLAAGEDSLAMPEYEAAKAGFRETGARHALKRCERLFRIARRQPPLPPAAPQGAEKPRQSSASERTERNTSLPSPRTARERRG